MTGTRVSTPPKSSPSGGAASTTTAARQTVAAAASARRGRPRACSHPARSAASSTIAVPINAKAVLPMPWKRPATIGLSPSGADS